MNQFHEQVHLDRLAGAVHDRQIRQVMAHRRARRRLARAERQARQARLVLAMVPEARLTQRRA